MRRSEPLAFVTIDGAPTRIEIRYALEVMRVEVDTVAEHINLHMQVSERYSGEFQSFTTRYPFKREARERMAHELGFSDEQVLGAFVRETVRAAVLHEVDESIFVGGELVFNPHAAETGGEDGEGTYEP